MLISDVISIGAFEKGAGPVFDSYMAPGDSTALDEATMKAVRAGRPNSILMPVIDMAVRAALGVCNLPEVKRIIPSEVLSRAEFAGMIAAESALMANKGRTSWTLLHFVNRPVLRDGIDENESLLHVLSNRTALVTASFAPFGDVGYLAGGAKRKLDGEGSVDNQASIVGQSQSLPLFGQIDAGSTRDLIEAELGGPPYIDPMFIAIEQAEDGNPVVSFTEEAVARLRQFIVPGHGCPAANVQKEAEADFNLLRESFRQITGYLLSIGATVNTG
jgi:hypothetical protein